MQTTVSPSQTFTVITSQQQKPSKSNVIEHYPHKQALVLGLLQVSFFFYEQRTIVIWKNINSLREEQKNFSQIIILFYLKTSTFNSISSGMRRSDVHCPANRGDDHWSACIVSRDWHMVRNTSEYFKPELEQCISSKVITTKDLYFVTYCFRSDRFFLQQELCRNFTLAVCKHMVPLLLTTCKFIF